MHRNFKDKSGSQYGKLTVLNLAACGAEKKYGSIQYIYNCYCAECESNSLIPSVYLRKNRKVCSDCQQEGARKVNKIPKQQMIANIERYTEYSVVSSDTWLSNSSWVLKCPSHGNFSSTYKRLMSDKCSCPRCADTYGFQIGLPAYFYVNYVLKDNCIIAFKYGITNQEPSKRLKQLSHKTDYDLKPALIKFFACGEDALSLERKIKKVVGSNFLSKNEMPVGYTETIDPESISSLLQYI